MGEDGFGRPVPTWLLNTYGRPEIVLDVVRLSVRRHEMRSRLRADYYLPSICRPYSPAQGFAENDHKYLPTPVFLKRTSPMTTPRPVGRQSDPHSPRPSLV